MAKAVAAPAITAAQAAAFRIKRHHLDGRSAEVDRRSAKAFALHLVDVVRDTGGIQAQVMSAAETAIWTRRRSTTRDEIRAGLFDRREIVKTSAMRLTLHLIPATELATVIAALRPMAMAVLQRWQARVGVTPDQLTAIEDVVMDGLRDGPQTQQDLIARARRGQARACGYGWTTAGARCGPPSSTA